MKTLMQKTLARNIQKMEICISQLNAKVIPFYQKYGFNPSTTKLPFYLPDGKFSGLYDEVMQCDDIAQGLKIAAKAINRPGK